MFLKSLVATALLFLTLGCETHALMDGADSESVTTRDWKILNDESGMTYVTVHSGSIAEINTFRAFDGSVTEDGDAQFVIQLESVDTNDAARDAAMRENIFKTRQYSTARFSAPLDMTSFAQLNTGDRHTELLDLKIELHGMAVERSFYVMVTPLGPNKVLVENKAPLILSAKDFGFANDIEAWAAQAGFKDVSPVVVGTFSLVFVR